MALGILNTLDSQGVNRVVDMGPVADDPAANPSYALTRGGPAGKVDTVTKTVLGVSWRKTLTYTGSNLTSVSAWVRL